MNRGEIWWARLPAPWGRRPVLLVARDKAYEILTWVMVAPITTTHRTLPTTVQLHPAADGVERACTIYLDHIQSIRADSLESFVARLRPERMSEVERAIRVALALPEATDGPAV